MAVWFVAFVLVLGIVGMGLSLIWILGFKTKKGVGAVSLLVFTGIVSGSLYLLKILQNA